MGPRRARTGHIERRRAEAIHMDLIPWQAKAGAAVVAAGAIFGGGWTVESWRAAAALDKEKLAHAADVQSLKDQWQQRVEQAEKVAGQTGADLDTERAMNAQEKADAEANYERELAKRDASNARLAADAGRVRDELAAAQ